MQTRHHYTAYGMSIAAEFELPELRVAPPGGGAADVELVYGNVAREGLAGGKQISPFIWTGPEAFLLDVPGVARFHVTGGRRIVVDPAPAIDEASVRVFLLGSALGALLFQRGVLVLHGNAIEMGEHCVICVGRSGVGKSTLTAAFTQRGYRVLADDVVPIDAEGFAIPGFPRIKLWQDVADRLGIDTRPLRRIRPELEKFNYPLGAAFCDQRRKVGGVFVLGSHHGQSVEITPITGMQKFTALQSNTYRHRFMVGMALEPAHLLQCSALAKKTPMALFERPKAGFEIDALVEALLAEVAEAG